MQAGQNGGWLSAIKKAWFAITVLATLSGAIGLVQLMTTVPEYALTLKLLSSGKIIENTTSTPDLTVLYRNTPIRSLHGTWFELENSGKRAITRDFIFDPLTVTASRTKILAIQSEHSLLTSDERAFRITWDLLNPQEKIKVLVLTTEPGSFSTKYKIREISVIPFSNNIANPPMVQRLQSTRILWICFFVFALLITTDAFFIVKHDDKLGEIFRFANSLRASGDLPTLSIIQEAVRLYSVYYDACIFLFVKPDYFETELLRGTTQSAVADGVEREKFRNRIIELSRFGNLYSTRSTNIFFGPTLALVCAVGGIVTFFF